MVATEAPVLDLWRSDRNAATIDRMLSDREFPRVQRAVITLMIVHPRTAVEDGRRELSISLRAAAAWLQRHCDTVAGMVCDHSAVKKALQIWIDRGVIAVTGSKSLRYTLETDRLRRWYDALPDADDLPVFRPISTEMSPDAAGGESCRPVVNRGECCGLPVNGGESCRPVVNRGDSHDESDDEFINSSSTQSSHSPAAERSGVSPNAPDTLTAAIRSLPDLPVGLWSPERPGRECVALLRAWWAEHGLQQRFGLEAERVRDALLGLISLARQRNNPPGYYLACLRNGVRPQVIQTGQQWIAASRREPVYTGR